MQRRLALAVFVLPLIACTAETERPPPASADAEDDSVASPDPAGIAPAAIGGERSTCTAGERRPCLMRWESHGSAHCIYSEQHCRSNSAGWLACGQVSE